MQICFFSEFTDFFHKDLGIFTLVQHYVSFTVKFKK